MAKKPAPTPKQIEDSFEAFNRIEAMMPGARGLPSAEAIESFVGNLCEQYARIKPYIEPALKFVEWLPKGETIAKIVRILARVADTVCTATSRQGRALPELIDKPRKPALDPDARFLNAREALDRLDQELPDVIAMPRALGLSDVCQYYRKIEPYINPILGYVEWLPYGNTISKIIRLLMRIAEAACG